MWDSVIVLCFVILYFMSILVFAIILMEKRGLIALFSLSRYCCVDLPRNAMGLSAVCDCGIF